MVQWIVRFALAVVVLIAMLSLLFGAGTDLKFGGVFERYRGVLLPADVRT